MIPKQRLIFLFRRFIHNEATPEEVKELLKYIRRAQTEELLKEQVSSVWQTLRSDEQTPDVDWDKMFNRIIYTGQDSTLEEMRYRKWDTPWLRIAAIFILLAGMYMIVQLISGSSHPDRVARMEKLPDTARMGISYNRFQVLPDGSKIVLHAGSKLTYPDHFNEISREVILDGEAYFDVKHEDRRPFIIHAGKLKATVLGTAFNIKAYPGSKEITITVTRGKVKVEDERNELAILTADNEIVYNTESRHAERNSVNAIEAINWAKSDMQFEAVPFKEITDRIGKRYKVHIYFSNASLEHCPITASFSGTESLKQVLEVLCGARNASYILQKNDEVMIDGEGCE